MGPGTREASWREQDLRRGRVKSVLDTEMSQTKVGRERMSFGDKGRAHAGGPHSDSMSFQLLRRHLKQLSRKQNKSGSPSGQNLHKPTPPGGEGEGRRESAILGKSQQRLQAPRGGGRAEDCVRGGALWFSGPFWT